MDPYRGKSKCKVFGGGTSGCMKTVHPVYCLLMNTIYLPQTGSLGTVFRKQLVLYKFMFIIKSLKM